MTAKSKNLETVNPQNICGVVMPISPTPNRGSLHWERVQQLLHRAIRSAGLEPQNVWDGSASDRITARILKNLFAAPILVCDISELNPNVMLELGMRLTSRKPTVVVVEEGGKIPFDIGDFEALKYPIDLNIIDMEYFLEKLQSALIDKLEASASQTYLPFLKEIGPIEVIEPDTKPVPFEQILDRRLSELMSKVEQLDKSLKNNTQWQEPSRASSPALTIAPNKLYVSVQGGEEEVNRAAQLLAEHDLITRIGRKTNVSVWVEATRNIDADILDEVTKHLREHNVRVRKVAPLGSANV